MSTDYHDPIETGESNSPNTINVRLGGLDSGIGAIADTLDNLVIGAGTSQAETIAARTGIHYKSGTPPSSLSVAMGYAAGDTYNVKAYGAVGDGVTDDRLAIQAALDAASSVGGVVFVPRGVYYLSSTSGRCLLLYDSITLRGVGQKSILDFRGSSDAHCIDLSGTADAAIENLQIRNNSAVSAGSAIFANGTDTVRMRVRHVIIRGVTTTKAISGAVVAGGTLTATVPSHGFTTGDDVHLYGTGTNTENATLDIMYTGITVTDANTFTVGGLTFAASSSSGVAQKTAWFNGIRVDGSDGLIEGCDIGDGFYTGIRLAVNALRVRVLHNTITGGFRGTMFDADNAPGGAYCLIAHNHYDSLKACAGKIEWRCVHNHICDNIITNCSNSAFFMATFEISGPYTTFERNHMIFSSPISVAAVDTVAPPSPNPPVGHFIIRDNTIQGHLGTVINLRSSTLYTVVSGNHIEGGSTGISAVGLFNRILGNTVTDVTQDGIIVSSITNFVVQNNTIANVANRNGIRLQQSCANGSIIANIIATVGAEGIFHGNSGNPGANLAFIGNVITDVGNTAASGSGFNITLSQNAPKLSLVGNVLDDTPENNSIKGTNVTSITMIGNAVQKAINVTGTTVVSANNI